MWLDLYHAECVRIANFLCKPTSSTPISNQDAD